MFQLELHAGQEVVVYDQNSSHPSHLSPESFLGMVLLKLERVFATVHLLSGRSPAHVRTRPGSGAVAGPGSVPFGAGCPDTSRYLQASCPQAPMFRLLS